MAQGFGKRYYDARSDRAFVRPRLDAICYLVERFGQPGRIFPLQGHRLKRTAEAIVKGRRRRFPNQQFELITDLEKGTPQGIKV